MDKKYHIYTRLSGARIGHQVTAGSCAGRGAIEARQQTMPPDIHGKCLTHRPLAHLKHRLDYPDLIADAKQVLKTLMPIEREAVDETHTYLVRFQPHRMLDNHIAGVVLTLVDMTPRNRATEALQQSVE